MYKDGKKNGFGKMTYSATINYQGHFRDDEMDGAGTYQTETGKYEGMFQNNYACGMGTWYDGWDASWEKKTSTFPHDRIIYCEFEGIEGKPLQKKPGTTIVKGER